MMNVSVCMRVPVSPLSCNARRCWSLLVYVSVSVCPGFVERASVRVPVSACASGHLCLAPRTSVWPARDGFSGMQRGRARFCGARAVAHTSHMNKAQPTGFGPRVAALGSYFKRGLLF